MSTPSKSSLYPRVSQLINTVLSLEKGRIFQVEGRRIYPSEVHLLLEVAAHPEATATELAAGLGVTKGAVSQTVTRLVRKGLLLKTRPPEGGNTLRLELTSAGSGAVAHFRRKTAGLRLGVETHLADLTPAQRQVVARFLDCLTAELKDLGQA